MALADAYTVFFMVLRCFSEGARVLLVECRYDVLAPH